MLQFPHLCVGLILWAEGEGETESFSCHSDSQPRTQTLGHLTFVHEREIHPRIWTQGTSVSFPDPVFAPAQLCCYYCALWDRLMSRNNMASSSSIEEKKNELLRRIAEKKKARIDQTSSNAVSSPCVSSSTGAAPQTSGMFTNDGNFLARFQAMQKSSTAKPAPPRPTVSMKLTAVKKATPPKPVQSRLDVFDNPEEDHGNFLANLRPLICRSLYMPWVSVYWFGLISDGRYN